MYSKAPMHTAIKQKDKNTKELLPRHEEILKILKDAQNGLAFGQLLNKLNVSKRTLIRDLQELKEQGFIIDKGKTRAKYWYFVYHDSAN